MYIKLNIQNKLLELLQEESKEEFRSPTQQVMYILNRHYKDKLSSLQIYNGAKKTLKVIKTHQIEPYAMEGEGKAQTFINKEPIVENKTKYQRQDDDYDYVDSDMIDF